MADKPALPALDAEGFLIEPNDWTEQVAVELARSEGRHLAQRLGPAAHKRLFELFPYGYPGQACKIAGMRRPRAWSTG